ncbi:hypothetical protein HHK36_028601 [Tetracentron sinense]|uniref:Nucleotide-diphospho-sugar transferase domain-containing protein n=1 Tax=Tetracentron sinense TaxID=13715 RepID=A0A834YG30_TETSI|nr:hypothetical protein HHK36_028601 [Tetracentron sinense]
MDYAKHNVGNLAIVSLIFAGVLYLFIWTPVISQPFFPFQNYQCPSSNTNAIADPRDELETALERASMANKTVIIAMVNKAYVEGDKTMLDLFLDSFWLGEETRSLVDHLLLVTVDQTAFDRCNFLRLHCYRLVTDGVDFGGEKLYMSEEFIKMMWRRTIFLGDVLKRGYSFIFTVRFNFQVVLVMDTDIMWLRNPFVRLSRNESEDLQLSTDEFNGDPWSEMNPINTGFYFVRSNNKTMALFDTWYSLKDNYTGMKEQDVLAKMMGKGVFKELDMRVRFLDTLYFSGFCQNNRNFITVTTVHANCCRTVRAKVADLGAVLRDWKRFKGSTGNDTLTVRWSWQKACFKSWILVNGSLVG